MAETISTVDEALQEKYLSEGVIEIAYQKAKAWPTCPRSALSGQDVQVISKIMAGATPSHRHGEAIWALYVDTFGRKPPLRVSSGAPTA